MLKNGSTGAAGNTAASASWDGVVRPARGTMLSHYGRLRHAGQPVEEGVRYVLAGFVRCRPLCEAWRELRIAPQPSGGYEDVSEEDEDEEEAEARG